MQTKKKKINIKSEILKSYSSINWENRISADS